MIFFQKIKKKLNKILEAKKKATSDFYLYKYKSYDEYKSIQTFHNKRKIKKTWATEKILNIVIRNIKSNYKKTRYVGLCHGARNGFEQGYIASKLNVSILGTDISETAKQFPKSIVWDFHKPKKEWIGSCDFVYSNSLDQSYKPKVALTTWLKQLKLNGLLFLEYGIDHGPSGAGEMDPFGCKPEYLPYLISEWFPHLISIKIVRSFVYKTDKTKNPIWIFVVKKIKNF